MQKSRLLISRLRLFVLRWLLRAIGLDAVTSHRICKQAEQVRSATRTREKERAEIHMLAQGLGLVQRESREDYLRVVGAFFPGHKSSETLTDEDHHQFLLILRAWARARAVQKDRAA
jgi:hypothetical protein